MRIHFIAIGGAAMHNLAIALYLKGLKVTGSDDVVFEPSKSRLLKHGLLPEKQGWYPETITTEIHAVILGMHAREDNPELLAAQRHGLKIYSYPEYIYKQSKEKTRVVIGGSHGKTTITSMIMHVLNYHGFNFDYLVGAQIQGFENMVKISDDANVMIIEGDEYLASPIDKRPKFHLYKANIAVISGIAWDHINVFPTFENYKLQFSKFIGTIKAGGKLIYCAEDAELKEIVNSANTDLQITPYYTPEFKINNGVTYLNHKEKSIKLSVFGKHNLMNLEAARLVCKELNFNEEQFYEAIKYFTGAAKRLELIAKNDKAAVYKDFAHSPSKLSATINAVKEQFPNRKLIACIELHTFSSLNKEFLSEYRNTLNDVDFPIVFIDNKTFEQKKITPYHELDLKSAFNNQEIKFFNQPEKIKEHLLTFDLEEKNLLLMSSGNFGGIDLKELAENLLRN